MLLMTSKALIEMGISHEEFITILKKKDKYEKMQMENQKTKDEIVLIQGLKKK